MQVEESKQFGITKQVEESKQLGIKKELALFAVGSDELKNVKSESYIVI
jgi:hypothetical protein